VSDSDFIGRGFAFPMRIDESGKVATSSGAGSIDGALINIISTAPGERVMRPEFGCAIWQLLFAPINGATMGLMEQAVREAAARWEPRAEVEEVLVTPNDAEQGRVDIAVSYRVRTSNDLRNLVYPFYVIPQEHDQP
jgi:uncharacterized protein